MDDWALLRKELKELSADLAQGLQGMSFLVTANKDAVDDMKQRVSHLEKEMNSNLPILLFKYEELKNLPREVATLQAYAEDLRESKREITTKVAAIREDHAEKKIEAEKHGNSLALWSAIGVALISAIASLLVHVLQ